MDNIKSKLSLALLSAIGPIVKPHSKAISLSTNNGILFLITDNNPYYDFYFKVEKEEINKNNAIEITFECKPYSNIENQAKGTKFNINGFKDHLTKWFENIEKYKTELLFDDSFERQYFEEFYNDFEIVDSDAKVKGFNFSQQIVLTDYLQNVKTYISEAQNGLSEEDRSYLEIEADLLIKALPTETKDTYIKKQSSFWAKVRKRSIKVCDFVIKEFAKEVIKEFTKKGIELGWQSLPNYIEHAKHLLS